MKNKILLMSVLLSFTTAASANWYLDIMNTIAKQAGITQGILNNELKVQRDILSTQSDIEKQMQQLNGHMTSHSGYGNYQLHDYHSYGNNAQEWSDVRNMAARGQGDGALGQMISSVAHEFPVDRDKYNSGINNSQARRYYAVKSETILAARAASQLDFNKIQQQIDYQHMLRQQIDQTKDIKASMDLANRIHIEGNLILLAVLRQSAMINQQHAITEQASVINALSNAKFLTK